MFVVGSARNFLYKFFIWMNIVWKHYFSWFLISGDPLKYCDRNNYNHHLTSDSSNSVSFPMRFNLILLPRVCTEKQNPPKCCFTIIQVMLLSAIFTDILWVPFLGGSWLVPMPVPLPPKSCCALKSFCPWPNITLYKRPQWTLVSSCVFPLLEQAISRDPLSCNLSRLG